MQQTKTSNSLSLKRIAGHKHKANIFLCLGHTLNESLMLISRTKRRRRTETERKQVFYA